MHIFGPAESLYTEQNSCLEKNIIKQADLKMWHYLNGIQLKEIEADIELLIGTDVPQVMKQWKIIKSHNNGPYAVQTLLD